MAARKKKAKKSKRKVARGAVARGRAVARKLKRRADGSFKPLGGKRKAKPRTCHCSAYQFPHAAGGGRCRG